MQAVLSSRTVKYKAEVVKPLKGEIRKGETMGFFERLDMELQKDLLNFVDAEEQRKGKTLGENLSADILRKLIDGKCRMTGCATDHGKKKMYIEYTFGNGEEE